MMEKALVSKRELNKARKRAEIVDVASRMFLEQGYGTTTMSGIADTLGGSKATLWAHFASKEDLFSAVIDRHVENFAHDVDEVLTGQGFSPGGLRRACLRFIDCLLRENSILLYRLVTSEGERFPEIRELFYTRGPVKLRCAITNFFATGFEPDEAARLTQLTVAAVTGYRSDVLIRPSGATVADHEAFVDNLLDHMIRPADNDAGQCVENYRNNS